MNVVTSSVVVLLARRLPGAAWGALARRDEAAGVPSAAVVHLAARSVIVMRIDATFAAFATAWESWIASGMPHAVVRDLRALDLAQRVRLSGLVLLVAALITATWWALADASPRALLPPAFTAVVALAAMSGRVVIARAWAARSQRARSAISSTRTTSTASATPNRD